MKTDPSLRIIVDVVVLVSVLLGWWYIALPVAVLAAWMLPYYFEFLLAGLIFDSLYGFGRGLGIFGYFGIVISVVALVLAQFLKLIVKG